MRKFIKWGLIVVVVLFVIGLIAVPSNKTKVEKEKEITPQILSDKESKILSVLLKDELKIFIDGGDSIISLESWNKLNKEMPLLTTANHLQTEYEKNEVSADQQYKDKNLLITGKVKEIAKDFTDAIVIRLQGGSNPFMTPNVHMEDGYTDYSAQLEKGQTVHLVCKGGGMIVGSAMLKECLPADVWADKALNDIMGNIPNSIESKDQVILKLKAITTVISNTLPNNSECFVQNGTANGCMKEISAQFEKENFQKSYNEEAKRIGVIAKNK